MARVLNFGNSPEAAAALRLAGMAEARTDKDVEAVANKALEMLESAAQERPEDSSPVDGLPPSTDIDSARRYLRAICNAVNPHEGLSDSELMDAARVVNIPVSTYDEWVEKRR